MKNFNLPTLYRHTDRLKQTLLEQKKHGSSKEVFSLASLTAFLIRPFSNFQFEFRTRRFALSATARQLD